MRTILIHSLSGSNNRLFDPNERDACNDPAIYLRERLGQLGYSLRTADEHPLADCEWVLFNDAISVNTYSGVRGFASRLKKRYGGKPLVRDLYRECLHAGMSQRMALFLWEAPAVSPENWDPKLHRLFSIIFTWHDDFNDGRKFVKIHWPQTREFPEVPRTAFSQKKLLVNISMNKYSRHPRELYSARRATIRHFEERRPNDFDLYGVGWERGAKLAGRLFGCKWQAYPSYRGIVRHKWEILPYYRFSVCYENIRDEPGYITEKLFDSMRAGCVPIYLGAPNIVDYVDADAFVDRRDFKSDAELEDYLLGMTEKEYASFQDAIQTYLLSDRFARFLPPAFADTIIRVLDL